MPISAISSTGETWEAVRALAEACEKADKKDERRLFGGAQLQARPNSIAPACFHAGIPDGTEVVTYDLLTVLRPAPLVNLTSHRCLPENRGLRDLVFFSRVAQEWSMLDLDEWTAQRNTRRPHSSGA